MAKTKVEKKRSMMHVGPGNPKVHMTGGKPKQVTPKAFDLLKEENRKLKSKLDYLLKEYDFKPAIRSIKDIPPKG